MAKVLRLFTSLIKLASAIEVFPLKIEAEMNLEVRQPYIGQGDSSDTGKKTEIIQLGNRPEQVHRGLHKKIAHVTRLCCCWALI